MSLVGRTHEMGLCDTVLPPAKADLPCKDQASATQLPAMIHASVHTLARKVAGIQEHEWGTQASSMLCKGTSQ